MKSSTLAQGLQAATSGAAVEEVWTYPQFTLSSRLQGNIMNRLASMQAGSPKDDTQDGHQGRQPWATNQWGASPGLPTNKAPDHGPAHLHDGRAGVLHSCLHTCLPRRAAHRHSGPAAAAAHHPPPLHSLLANAAILASASSPDHQWPCNSDMPSPAQGGLLAQECEISRALGASAVAAAAATAALVPQLAMHRATSTGRSASATPDSSITTTTSPCTSTPADAPGTCHQPINLCSFCGHERPCSAPCPLAVAVATLQGLHLQGIYATGRFRVACFSNSGKGSQGSGSPIASSTASLSALTSPPDSPPDSPSRATHRYSHDQSNGPTSSLCHANLRSHQHLHNGHNGQLPAHPASASSSQPHSQLSSAPASRDSSCGGCQEGPAGDAGRVPGSSSASSKRAKRYSQVQVQRRGRFMVVTYDDVVTAAKAAALAAIVSAGDEDGGVAAAQYAATASLCEAQAQQQLAASSQPAGPCQHMNSGCTGVGSGAGGGLLKTTSCVDSLLTRGATAHDDDASHAAQLSSCLGDTAVQCVAAAAAAAVLEHAASCCAQAAMEDCNDVVHAFAIAAGTEGEALPAPVASGSDAPAQPPLSCSFIVPSSSATATQPVQAPTPPASVPGSAVTTPFKNGVSKVYKRGRFNILEIAPASSTAAAQELGARSPAMPRSAAASPSTNATPAKAYANASSIDRIQSEGSISLGGAPSLSAGLAGSVTTATTATTAKLEVDRTPSLSRSCPDLDALETVAHVDQQGADVSGSAITTPDPTTGGMPCAPGSHSYNRQQDMRQPLGSCSPTVPSHLSFSYWIRPGGIGPILQGPTAAFEPGQATAGGDGLFVRGGSGRVCSRLGSKAGGGQQLFCTVQEQPSCSSDDLDEHAAVLPDQHAVQELNLAAGCRCSTSPSSSGAASGIVTSCLAPGYPEGQCQPPSTTSMHSSTTTSPGNSPFSRLSECGAALCGSPAGVSDTMVINGMDGFRLSYSISHGGTPSTTTITAEGQQQQGQAEQREEGQQAARPRSPPAASKVDPAPPAAQQPAAGSTASTQLPARRVGRFTIIG